MVTPTGQSPKAAKTPNPSRKRRCLRARARMIASAYSYDTHSPRQRALFEDLSHKVGRIVVEGAIVSCDAYARYRADACPV